MKGENGTRFAQAYIEVLEHYASPYFMNNGDELIGYESDEGRELLTQYLRESGASLAMVEQNDQSQNITWPGTVELLNSIDYHGIRVFTAAIPAPRRSPTPSSAPSWSATAR